MGDEARWHVAKQTCIRLACGLSSYKAAITLLTTSPRNLVTTSLRHLVTAFARCLVTGLRRYLVTSYSPLSRASSVTFFLSWLPRPSLRWPVALHSLPEPVSRDSGGVIARAIAGAARDTCLNIAEHGWADYDHQ